MGLLQLTRESLCFGLLLRQLPAQVRFHRIDGRLKRLSSAQILLVKADIGCDQLTLRVAHAIDFEAQTSQDMPQLVGLRTAKDTFLVAFDLGIIGYQDGGLRSSHSLTHQEVVWLAPGDDPFKFLYFLSVRNLTHLLPESGTRTDYVHRGDETENERKHGQPLN